MLPNSGFGKKHSTVTEMLRVATNLGWNVTRTIVKCSNCGHSTAHKLTNKGHYLYACNECRFRCTLNHERS